MARKELQIFKAEDPCQASEIWFSAICLTAACGCNLPKAMFQKKPCWRDLVVGVLLNRLVQKWLDNILQHFPKNFPIHRFLGGFRVIPFQTVQILSLKSPPFEALIFQRWLYLKLQVKLLQRFVLSPESSSLVLNIGL